MHLVNNSADNPRLIAVVRRRVVQLRTLRYYCSRFSSAICWLSDRTIPTELKNTGGQTTYRPVVPNPGGIVLSDIQKTVLKNNEFFYTRVPSCIALIEELLHADAVHVKL